MKIKNDDNDKVKSLLKRLAGDGDHLIGVVQEHKKGVLTFKIDDEILLGLDVDVKKGLRAGQSFKISLETLEVLIDDKPVELPAQAVKKTSPSVGCTPAQRDELKCLLG